MARDFSGTLVSKLFEPVTGLKCVDRHFCCDFVSKGGRCQKVLAPNYSSIVRGKIACSAFVLNGRPLGDVERPRTVIEFTGARGASLTPLERKTDGPQAN
jgi:hypothetical protein